MDSVGGRMGVDMAGICMRTWVAPELFAEQGDVPLGRVLFRFWSHPGVGAVLAAQPAPGAVFSGTADDGEIRIHEGTVKQR